MEKKTIKDGMIITLEGGEGCGKSTLAKLIEAALSSSYQVVRSREPGGIELAEKIRELILYNEMDKVTELFLFEACRRIHWEDLVRPSLGIGKIVILDRFTTSTIVYQGMDNAIPLDRIQQCNNIATDYAYIKNKLEFILDVSVDTGMKRAGMGGHEQNKNDLAPREFHEKIRARYLDTTLTGCRATNGVFDPKYYTYQIDASQGIDDVFCQVMKIINAKLDSMIL